MVLIRSKLEDNTQNYTINSGSGREGLLVYQLSTTNTVALAVGSALLTSYVLGAITQDNNTRVEVSIGGDVELIAESLITINAGDQVFLSATQQGKVTNVAPSIGVVVNIGDVRSVNGLIINAKLTISQPIVL